MVSGALPVEFGAVPSNYVINWLIVAYKLLTWNTKSQLGLVASLSHTWVPEVIGAKCSIGVRKRSPQTYFIYCAVQTRAVRVCMCVCACVRVCMEMRL